MQTCRTCSEVHAYGYTHQPRLLYESGIYVCEVCATAGLGSVAIGDGTLCRDCMEMLDATV